MSSIGVLAVLASGVVGGIEHRSSLSYPYSSNYYCFIRWDRSNNVGVRRALRPQLASKTTNNDGELERARLRFRGLAEDGLSYKERFVVRFHEVGCDQTVTVQAIANYFQEIGCNHFRSTGFTTEHGFPISPTMAKYGLIWVMSRMHIQVDRYPAWNDVIEIETWTQSKGNINARRDWIISDYATGQVIGRATCKFLLMNRETRRFQRAPNPVLEELLEHCPKQPRSAFPEANNCSSIKKIEKLDTPPQYSTLGLTPRRVDFDMNEHVNYVTYIGWLLESVPSDIHLSHELQSLTLDFKRECGHNDIIDSFTTHESEGVGGSKNQCSEFEHGGTENEYNPCPKDGEDGLVQFLHLLRLSGKGLETNRGRTKWRKRKTLLK